jgi:hypothetical protein
MMGWAGHLACIGEKFIQGFGWKHEEKRLLVKHRNRLEYNNKKDQ